MTCYLGARVELVHVKAEARLVVADIALKSGSFRVVVGHFVVHTSVSWTVPGGQTCLILMVGELECHA